MRLTKMLGLVAVAAVAAMAFVGAGSASAAIHEYIGLCSQPELLLCAEKNIIPWNSGQILAVQIGTGEFKGGLITEKCTGGMGKGEITSPEMSEVNNLKGKITSLTFSGCKPCTTVTVTTPVNVHMSMKGINEEPWTLETTENGHAEFSGCTFGATCIFGGKNITSLMEMTETESIMNTNGTELEFQGGTGGKSLCGSSGKWFAKFRVTFTLAGGMEDVAWLTLLEKV